MKQILMLIFLTFFTCSIQARGFCNRQSLDPEFATGLVGNYEVIGKDPISGNTYAGTLTINHGKTSFLLTRTVGKRSVNGEAWIERCSTDKYVVLMARYYDQSTIEVGCTINMDGDNYNRTTCRTRKAGGKWHGLESWFQKY